MGQKVKNDVVRTGDIPSTAKENGIQCRMPGARIGIEVLEDKNTQPTSDASWKQADSKNLMALPYIIFTTASEVPTTPFQIYPSVGHTSCNNLTSPCSMKGTTYC